MKRGAIIIILVLSLLLIACESQVQPVQKNRANIPQIEISVPKAMPAKPRYEPPPTPPTQHDDSKLVLPNTVEVEIDVTDTEFLPSEIKAKKGDTVILKLTSVNIGHEFYLDTFGIEEDLPLGKDVEIKFIANLQGMFIFRTNVTGMQGILNVR